MSGIGPLGGPNIPDSLRSINKDGGGNSGSGGYYGPNYRNQEEPHDEAELSEEAKELSRKQQEAANARPEAADARLEILSEIQTFNEHHERASSRLKAILKPGAANASVLHIEDPNSAVDLKPFGDKDIYHYSPQEVRARLQTFDSSRGSIFDTKL